MKKIILLLSLFACAMCVGAQTYKFTATDMSYRYYDEARRRWTEWTDWEDCRMLVVFSVDRDLITIYSKEIQEYDIVENLGDEKDSEGGETAKMLCVNRDGLRCHVRLRMQKNGQRQLYIDFNDMMWVYCLEER